MTQQDLDFGTSAANDGEFLPTAFLKIQENFDDVYASLREKLTADRTYYVRSDGSDGNTGLADTSGGAFLTLQKAVDVISGTLDLAGFDATIQLADGTYTGAYLKKVIGSDTYGGVPIIKGNTSTPDNVVVTHASDYTFVAEDAGYWRLLDFKLTNTDNSPGIFAEGYTHIEYGNLNFGSCGAGTHVWANREAMVQPISNYTISGNAGIHIFSGQGATIEAYGITITLTGTPAFAQQFARVRHNGRITWQTGIFTGSATGSRYHAGTGGFLDTNDAGETYFPGDAVGTIEKGGWYDDHTLFSDLQVGEVSALVAALAQLSLQVTVTSAGVGNLHALLHAAQGLNGEGPGIGFSCSADPSNVGAKIGHVRSGSNSKGGFGIWTKPDTSSGDTTVLRYFVDDAGRPVWSPSTTTPATLAANGDITMTLTSDTNLRFSARGSDGVTRVANITLS